MGGMHKFFLLITVLVFTSVHAQADFAPSLEERLNRIEQSFAEGAGEPLAAAQTLILADLKVLAKFAQRAAFPKTLSAASAVILNRHLVLGGPALVGGLGQSQIWTLADQILDRFERHSLRRVFPRVVQALIQEDQLLSSAMIVGRQISSQKAMPEVAADLGLPLKEVALAHSNVTFARHLALLGVISKKAPAEHVMRALGLLAIADYLGAELKLGGCAGHLERARTKSLPSPSL